MDWLIRFAVITAIAWCGLVAFMYVFQRSFQYMGGPPSPPPAQTTATMAEEVTLSTADGLNLIAWWADPNVTVSPIGGSPPVVIYFHGNAGNLADREDRVGMLWRAGFAVLMVEYRGFGGNPGSPTEQGLLHDARAATAIVQDKGFAPDQLVFYGESLGSGVAFQLAAEGPKPRAIVVEGAFTSAVDMGKRRYPFLPVSWLMKDRYDSMAVLPQLSDVPLLVLHGEQDHIVPTDMGRSLLAAHQGPKKGVFPADARHVDLFAFGAVSHMLSFLDQSQ